MPAVRTSFVLILLLGLADFSSIAQATAAQRHSKAKIAAKQVQPDPPPPVAPPVPLTPAQMPATPPQVTYDNGALTIVAQNSTLGDILRAVHTQTGAVMDISGSATERVVSRFGPGSPRDVLAQLLNGSSYNYVILGSPTDAGTVQKVVLTPKSPTGTEAQSEQVATANPVSRVQPAQEATEDDAEDSSDADAGGDEPAATPAESAAQPNQPQGQPPVKTPEQLLQELQRQQQLLQQQQQQGQQGVDTRSGPNLK